jgi:hypothetical protein
MLLSGTSRCLHNTQIQCGQSVQLLNVKPVDASPNQKVNMSTSHEQCCARMALHPK